MNETTDPYVIAAIDYRLRMAAASARIRQALIALEHPMARTVDSLLADALAELEAPPMRDLPTEPGRINGKPGRRADTQPNQRDLDIVHALASGLSHSAVARQFGYRSQGSISLRVVKLARMLDVEARTHHVVAAALEAGWI